MEDCSNPLPQKILKVSRYLTTESNEVFSEFPPAEILQGERLGRFGTAQLQDPALSQAWGNVQVVEAQLQDRVSRLTYPHFMIKNKLLYRVDQQRGEIVEQCLVPKPYASKVLYLAHTHLLGGHLGAEKTYERILTRFYWPDLKPRNS